jgi:hypothetical protein
MKRVEGHIGSMPFLKNRKTRYFSEFRERKESVMQHHSQEVFDRLPAVKMKKLMGKVEGLRNMDKFMHEPSY